MLVYIYTHKFGVFVDRVVVAIPSTLSLVAAFLHSLGWIFCFHFYLKLFQILHCCGFLLKLRPPWAKLRSTMSQINGMLSMTLWRKFRRTSTQETAKRRLHVSQPVCSACTLSWASQAVSALQFSWCMIISNSHPVEKGPVEEQWCTTHVLANASRPPDDDWHRTPAV